MADKKSSRLDEKLVQMGLADSIQTAHALIMSGSVIVDDQRVDKAGTLIAQSARVRLKEKGLYVSRGGDKLLSAIQQLAIADQFRGKIILDVGASTGGFTDCLLQHGAKIVIALDVGTAQLDWKLRTHPQVISIEQTDIKNFKSDNYPRIDWVVVDVSFTSLSKLIPHIHNAAPAARLLLLVKPQFELPKEKIPSGGVVIDEGDRNIALQLVIKSLETAGYVVEKTIDAAVTGRQGNREMFILTA